MYCARYKIKYCVISVGLFCYYTIILKQLYVFCAVHFSMHSHDSIATKNLCHDFSVNTNQSRSICSFVQVKLAKTKITLWSDAIQLFQFTTYIADMINHHNFPRLCFPLKSSLKRMETNKKSSETKLFSVYIKYGVVLSKNFISITVRWDLATKNWGRTLCDIADSNFL